MAIVYNELLFGFVASDSRLTVYLKQSTECNKYAVKIMHKDGTKTVVKETYSLSDAVRELAETIAQHTNGFTTWRKL